VENIVSKGTKFCDNFPNPDSHLQTGSLGIQATDYKLHLRAKKVVIYILQGYRTELMVQFMLSILQVFSLMQWFFLEWLFNITN